MDTDADSTDPELRLRALFDAHHRAVVAYVARRTVPPGDVETAQDVAARVFAVAWRRLGDLPAEPRAWLLVTARRILSEEVRGRRRQARTEERRTGDRALTRPAVPDPVDAVTDAVLVTAALAGLSADDRELVLLVAWDDLPLTTAAEVLGIRPDAARTRWLRVRRRLARLLAAEAPPTPTAVLPFERLGVPR